MLRPTSAIQKRLSLFFTSPHFRWGHFSEQTIGEKRQYPDKATGGFDLMPAGGCLPISQVCADLSFAPRLACFRWRDDGASIGVMSRRVLFAGRHHLAFVHRIG